MSGNRDQEINQEPSYDSAEFYLDHGEKDDRGFYYEGYSYGGNTDPDTGHALPFFTKEVANEIMNNMNVPGLEHPRMVYNESTDSYVYYPNPANTEEYYIWKGQDFKAYNWEDGTLTVHVYAIGQESETKGTSLFPWKEITKSWIYVTVARCPYCGEDNDSSGETCKNCGREVDF